MLHLFYTCKQRRTNLLNHCFLLLPPYPHPGLMNLGASYDLRIPDILSNRYTYLLHLAGWHTKCWTGHMIVWYAENLISCVTPELRIWVELDAWYRFITGYNAISMHKTAVITAQSSIHKPCSFSHVKCHVMLLFLSWCTIASTAYHWWCNIREHSVHSTETSLKG